MHSSKLQTLQIPKDLSQNKTPQQTRIICFTAHAPTHFNLEHSIIFSLFSTLKHSVWKFLQSFPVSFLTQLWFLHVVGETHLLPVIHTSCEMQMPCDPDTQRLCNQPFYGPLWPTRLYTSHQYTTKPTHQSLPDMMGFHHYRALN